MIDAQVFLWNAYTRQSPSPSMNRYGKIGKAIWAIAKIADARINERGSRYLCLSALNTTPLKTTSSQIGTSTIAEASNMTAPGVDTSNAVVFTEDSGGLRLNIAAKSTWVSSAPSKTSGACHSICSSRQDIGLNPRDAHEMLDRPTHHSINETVAIDITPIVQARPSSATDLSSLSANAKPTNTPSETIVTTTGTRLRIISDFDLCFMNYIYFSMKHSVSFENKKDTSLTMCHFYWQPLVEELRTIFSS